MDYDELEQFLGQVIADGSLVAPFADPATGAQVREWARTFIARELASLSVRKNIARDRKWSETLAAFVVDQMSPKALIELISGAPFGDSMHGILGAVETELDFTTVVATVRAYAEAAGVGDAPPAALRDIAMRMIQRRKANTTPERATLRWPSPDRVRKLAAQELGDARRPRDIVEIEQALVNNQKLVELCMAADNAEAG